MVTRKIRELFSDNPGVQEKVTSAVAGWKQAVEKPDFAQFHQYTNEDDIKSKNKPTAVTRFTNGQLNLYYINSAHTDDPNSPTFKTIEGAIEKYKPQAIVVEAKDVNRLPEGEATHTAKIAHQNGITIIAGEPNDAIILSGLKQEGYSKKDMMGLYLLRSIAHDRNRPETKNLMDEKHFSGRVDDYLKGYAKSAGIPANEQLSFQEFQDWYAQHNSSGKNYLETTANDLKPVADGTYFQKMHSIIAKAREENLDNIIAKAVNEHGSVLVVYGGAHLTQSQPIFEKMFDNKGQTEILIQQESPVHSQQQSSHKERVNIVRGGYIGR